MNQTLTLACLIAAGVGLVLQNTLMVRITQSASTILIAMLLNSLVGIVIFVTILLLKHGAAGFQELAVSVKWWTLIPGLLGSFFVFASISGYQNVGAATTIAVLIASQLVGVSDGSDSRAPRPASRADWPALRRGDAGGRRLAGGQTPVLAA
jgi:transporter family-2 protein